MTEDERQAILAKANAYTVADYAQEIPPRLLKALARVPVFPEQRIKRRRQTEKPNVVLSETELRVAGLLVDGLTNKQIGARLFLSPWTVASHVARLLAKLDLASRVELAVAVARAQERRPG